MSDQKRVESSWIEELYRYAEYYQGERQHLELPREQARKRMRSTEVPLNAILNITLRLLPASTTERLLQLFLVDHSPGFGVLELRRPYPDDPKLGHTVQPDVSLESETARVFIELKVNARFSLEQVQKYVLLHALCNSEAATGRSPYLFFLSPKQLCDQWQTGKGDSNLEKGNSPEELLAYLRAATFPEKLGSHELTSPDQVQVSQVLRALRVGAATWQSFGDAVRGELTRRHHGPVAEAEDTTWKLLNDLLGDLTRRKLWKSST